MTDAERVTHFHWNCSLLKVMKASTPGDISFSFGPKKHCHLNQHFTADICSLLKFVLFGVWEENYYDLTHYLCGCGEQVLCSEKLKTLQILSGVRHLVLFLFCEHPTLNCLCPKQPLKQSLESYEGPHSLCLLKELFQKVSISLTQFSPSYPLPET